MTAGSHPQDDFAGVLEHGSLIIEVDHYMEIGNILDIHSSSHGLIQ